MTLRRIQSKRVFTRYIHFMLNSSSSSVSFGWLTFLLAGKPIDGYVLSSSLITTLNTVHRYSLIYGILLNTQTHQNEMRFPISTPLLLLLQARPHAGVRAFTSPFLSQALASTCTSAFIHRNNKNKSPGSFRKLSTNAPEATLSTDDVDVEMSDIVEAANASRAITTTSTSVASFGSLPYVNTSLLSSKSQHRVLFILGGPGAGKGTQSEKIVENFKCIHLSVGELLRTERQRGNESPHAELIESCLVAGKIVPVEISLNLLRNAMDEATQKSKDGDGDSYGAPIFLVDGFPRNFDNLAGWTKEMPEYAAVIGSLVYDCPIDVLEHRIMGRAATSGRSDDNLESARKRFKTFQGQTMPVVRALEEVEKMEIEEEGIGRLHVQHIEGTGTIDEVWDATKTTMNRFLINDVVTANSLLMKAIAEKNVDLYTELCNDTYLEGEGDDTTVEGTFKEYELLEADNTSEVSNASVEIQDGTKAVVTYERTIKDPTGETIAEFRESRVWSHGQKGWTCIHFLRKPLSEP